MWLINDGYKWNEDRIFLSTITRSCHMVNYTIKPRLQIESPLLELILFEVKRKFNDQPYLRSLYMSMIGMAFYGLFRIGELTLSKHTIKAANIPIGSNKNKILVVLHSSKMHGKESYPQKVKISSVDKYKHHRKRFFCPFELI